MGRKAGDPAKGRAHSHAQGISTPHKTPLQVICQNLHHTHFVELQKSLRQNLSKMGSRSSGKRMAMTDTSKIDL